MHAQIPQPCRSESADTAHDTASDPVPSSPFSPRMVWSADDLVEAVRLPLHCEAFAPSANDARLHRPRRTLRFLATPPLAARFRIGG